MFRPLLSFHRRLLSQSNRFHRRFTTAGQVVWGGIIATAAIGVDTQLSQVYQLFSLLLVTMFLAMAASWRFSPHVEVRRLLPRLAMVGKPLTYELEIRSLGKPPQLALEVIDQLTAPPINGLEMARFEAPGERRINAFDRMVGFRRYLWLHQYKRGGSIAPGHIDQLPPHQGRSLSLTLTPERRGYVQWQELIVARQDPLGLCRAFHRVQISDSLLVLPRLYPLPPGFAMPGGRCHQRGGVSLASSVGDAEEFVSLRDYREGDSPRHIHWPSLAKSGKPVVREYQEEYFVRHALVLDTITTKANALFEEAVSVAASFAMTVENSETLLDLLFVGETAHRFTSGRGLGQAEQFLEILAAVSPNHDQPFSRLAKLVLESVPYLSGTILVLLAWDDARRTLVGRLINLGIPILVLLVVAEDDPGPVDPGPLAATPDRLRILPVGRIAQELARL
ncbi:MAG: DUF58 domain-containing protein [Magnetococcales bacterium]|nr:DUF58 domain-containing protein [Magnetococcales bacterium]